MENKNAPTDQFLGATGVILGSIAMLILAIVFWPAALILGLLYVIGRAAYGREQRIAREKVAEQKAREDAYWRHPVHGNYNNGGQF